jgi:hypothetical protein
MRSSSPNPQLRAMRSTLCSVPTTAQHFVYELQQDWSRQETYQGVIDIMKAHTAFGTQIFFSKWALGGHDSALKAAQLTAA